MLPESDARPALGFMVAAMGLWEMIRRFRKSWVAVGD